MPLASASLACQLTARCTPSPQPPPTLHLHQHNTLYKQAITMDTHRGSSRGNFRGNNSGGGGGRGGRGGGRGGGAGGAQQERKPREAILDLGKFRDKAITVKFNGGREGTLRGERAG